ncbi:MAG: hypothetical protein ACFFDY_00420 [Candidatus Thorarchaeota archaeon]
MKKIFIFSLIVCFFFFIYNIAIAANTFVTEGFEGPGYENAVCDPNIITSCWTEYTDGNSFIDSEYECSCNPPESGDYCLRAYSDGNGELAKITWILDEISPYNEVSVRVKLIDHNLGNTDQVQIANITTNSGSKLIIVYYYYYNSTMYMAARYFDGTGGFGDSDFYEVNENDWNLVSFQYDSSRLRFKLKINHKTTLKDTDLDNTWPINARKLDLGVCYNNGDGSAEVLISSMEWDD